MNKNKILVVEPNKEPFVKTVQDIEKSIVEIVGTDLTYLRLAKRIDIVYNDDGKLEDLPFNRVIKDDVLCGKFVIVAHHKDEWISLTNKQIKFYKKKFQVRFDKPLIEFLNKELKQSSNLLNCNLKGIEKLNKMIVSDRKMKKLEESENDVRERGLRRKKRKKKRNISSKIRKSKRK